MLLFDQGEKIILEVRRHWFVIAVELAVLALFALAPFFLVSVLAPYLPAELAAFLSRKAALFIYALWFLYLWMFGFLFWTDYYLDVLVLTNKRIIEFEQKGLFNYEASSFRLDRIQDVTTETSGLIAHLLGFGDIHIQTAGRDREFLMRSVARPESVKQIILNAHHQALAGAGSGA